LQDYEYRLAATPDHKNIRKGWCLAKTLVILWIWEDVNNDL